MVSEITSIEKKSVLVQIMNEVDEFTPDEKNFILYWLKAKKNAHLARESDLLVIPNNMTLDDIYAERDAMRKEKLQ